VKIIRKNLSEADLLPPGTRYDEPTDTVQTFDGTSWIDTPERDPRNIDSYPPPATADPRCDGAARMSAFLEEIVGSIIDGVDAEKSDAEIALIVLGVLALIPFINLLYILVASLIGALIIVGSTWLHDAFDTFVWDDLTCLIYARLNENGFITDGGLEWLRADISAEFGVDPASVLLDILVFVGRGGLNDAAALRTETGDCSACPTTWTHRFYADSPELLWWRPYQYNLTCARTSDGWYGQHGATESDGSGNLRWIDTPRTSTAYWLGLAGQIQLPTGSTLTAITWGAQQTVGANLDGWFKWRRVNAASQCWQVFYTGFNGWTGSLAGPLQVDWEINWWNNNANGFRLRVNYMDVSGTGVDPFVT